MDCIFYGTVLNYYTIVTLRSMKGLGTMIDSWNITIPELTGDEPRRAYIYLPDSWEMDPDLRYPVLYMFDGHNVFFDEDATYGKSWGMGEYLDATQTQRSEEHTSELQSQR